MKNLFIYLLSFKTVFYRITMITILTIIVSSIVFSRCYHLFFNHAAAAQKDYIYTKELKKSGQNANPLFYILHHYYRIDRAP